MEEKQKCHACGQTIDYVLDMDRGSCSILKELAKFIRAKGINAVHPNKEMVKIPNPILSARQLDNIVRLKFHGLVAHLDGERGNYALTRKGLAFLNGEPIPKSVTIKKKAEGERAHVVLRSDKLVTIADIDKEWGPWWSSNGYEIHEGRVIYAQNP